MQAQDFVNSIAGVVAIIGAFLTPIAIALIVMLVLLNLGQKRHVERLKMIEAGLVPPPEKTKRPRFGLLITGAVLFAFGLALVIAQLASGDHSDLEGGFIFAFIGAALLICFVVIRYVKWTRSSESDKTEPADKP